MRVRIRKYIGAQSGYTWWIVEYKYWFWPFCWFPRDGWYADKNNALKQAKLLKYPEVEEL